MSTRASRRLSLISLMSIFARLYHASTPPHLTMWLSLESARLGKCVCRVCVCTCSVRAYVCVCVCVCVQKGITLLRSVQTVDAYQWGVRASLSHSVDTNLFWENSTERERSRPLITHTAARRDASLSLTLLTAAITLLNHNRGPVSGVKSRECVCVCACVCGGGEL